MSARLTLRPRCSLTPQAARAVLWSACLVSFSGSVAACAMGAWPALVFSALWMCVLWLGLRQSLAAGGDSETVELSESEVIVRSQRASGTSSCSFPRYWARVRLYPPADRLGVSRLMIECGRRRLEIGAFLTDAERQDLARRLVRMLKEPAHECHSH